MTTTAAGPYANLRINQARTRIIEDLKNAGLLEKEENIMHKMPLCERSKTPIEILSLSDYYIKQLNYIPQLKELAMKINFHPEMHRKILLNWLDSVSIDWPISRRRFYGTEITAKLQTFPNLVNITVLGKKNLHLKNVVNVVVLNLLVRKGHLILGWIPALLPYLLQNTEKIKNYTITLIPQK
jgi:valyl-tRNA synthetase